MIVLLNIILISCLSIVSEALVYATRGSVWPQPTSVKLMQTAYIYDPQRFIYTITHYDCELLQIAISRCKKKIGLMEKIAEKERKKFNVKDEHEDEPDKLNGLRITLNSACETYPHNGMNESYILTVSTVSELRSNTIWGIIRGLESFSQLLSLTEDNTKVFVKGTKIVDFPRYPYRGLMLDTTQHYVFVDTIFKTLDGMAMNKLNVFHWRIANDRSLIPKTVNHPITAYTKKDIRNIVEYARKLGIRVVPEFNIPLHAGPHKILQSEEDVTLHPLHRDTYKLLRILYKEAQQLFPDDYFHLGKVDLSLWVDEPELKEYMAKHLENSIFNLHEMYIGRINSTLRKGTVPLVWESSKDVEASIPKNFIVQINKKNWLSRGIERIKDGRQIICTIYLDQGTQFHMEYSRFEAYYTEDQRTKLYELTSNHDLDEKIIGQVAVIRTDEMDTYFIKSRTWLHISVVAEVLWSHTGGMVAEKMLRRLAEHDCRMAFRNVHTGSKEVCLDNREVSILEDEAHPLDMIKAQVDDDAIEWGSLVKSLTSPNH